MRCGVLVVGLAAWAALVAAGPLTAEEKELSSECSAQCKAVKETIRDRKFNETKERNDIKQERQGVTNDLKAIRKDIRDGVLTGFKDTKDALKAAQIKDLDQFLLVVEEDYNATKAQIEEDLAEIQAILDDDESVKAQGKPMGLRSEAAAALEAKLAAAAAALANAKQVAQDALNLALASLENCEAIPAGRQVVINNANIVFSTAVNVATQVFEEVKQEAYDYLEEQLAELEASRLEAESNATLAQDAAFQEFQAILADPIEDFLIAKQETREDFTENNAIAADLKTEAFSAADEAYNLAVDAVAADYSQRLEALYDEIAEARAGDEAAQDAVCEEDCYVLPPATTAAPPV